MVKCSIVRKEVVGVMRREEGKEQTHETGVERARIGVPDYFLSFD